MTAVVQSRSGLRPAHVLIVVLALLAVFSAKAGPFINDVNTDKAMYSPGEPVAIYVDLTNSTASAFNGTLQIVISHLGYVSTNLPSEVISNLGPNLTTAALFSWTPPATDYRGYLISVSLRDTNGNAADSGSSAIDVSSDWSKFPRYGYVGHYGAGVDAYHIMWELKNYHINGVQFYDWQWKHHVPYNPGATWPDVANRTIYRSTVSNLIAAAHFYNMMAMNYNSYGMAYSNYLSDGSGVTLSMGIFSSLPASQANQIGFPLPNDWATPTLCEMNNRDANWQNYIFTREQAVFNHFAFDGWHIDSVGQHTAYDYNGNFFSLDDYNPEFINNAKAALGKRLVFNTVDAGGENQVAQSADVDFVYSELWSGNANYNDFNQRVNNVRSYCSKALVMPAYMDSGLSSGYFNEPGVLLADAAMFACGGAHLELGDGNGMLHTDYFPNDASVVMSPSLTAAMHVYYDFLVGYENLLRGNTVSANNAATIAGVATSTDGSAGTVWVISKKTFGYNVIHLINLLSTPSTVWRDANGTCPAPTTISNLAVKMYYSGAISGGKLWYATPDTNFGAATQLSYTTSSDGGGNYISFTVPQLQYWDMIWLELNGTTSAANQIRAEHYDSMSAIGLESTSDAGGGMDVCDVKNTGGDSYVAFNNIDFGAGPSSVSARVASAAAGGTVEFHLDSPTGTLIATAPVGNTGGWQSWQTVTAAVSGASGVHKLFAVFKNAASNLNGFQFNFDNLNDVLPAPWMTADIGAVGLAGGAAWLGGTFTLKGSGADIESTADGFRYVYQSCGSHCELRARVASVQNTDPWAKAGVMFRNDSSAGAMNVAVVVTADNGVEFQQRTSTGSGTSGTVIPGVTAPCWVRLVRSTTNSFTGYYSADGSDWTQIGTAITIPMNSSALAGLADTAHNNATNCIASFDNVSVNNAPVLAAVSNRTIVAGATLTVTNSAGDADVPQQTLTFSLLKAPTNADIDPGSGVFTWRPAVAQSSSTQFVSESVSDNGTPVMSANRNFTVMVARPVRPTLDATWLTNGQFKFWINGDAGPDYIIQFSTNLETWSKLATLDSPLLPFTWGDTNAIKFNSGFYRVLLGP